MSSYNLKKDPNGGWVAELDSDAPVIIEGEPTKANKDVLVDMSLQLSPQRIHYPEKYSEEEILSGLEKLEQSGCKLCKSTEKTVAMLMRDTLKDGPPPAPAPVPEPPPPNGAPPQKNGPLGIRNRLPNQDRPMLNNFQQSKNDRPVRDYRVFGRFRGEEQKRLFSRDDVQKMRPRVSELFEVDYD